MTAIERVYKQHCIQRFSPPKPAEIELVETRLGNGLPQSYRQYLLEYNGGIFDEPELQLHDQSIPAEHVSFMCGITSEEGMAALARKQDLAIFEDNFPVELLKIGSTVSGGLLLLVIDPDCEDEDGDIAVKTVGHGIQFLADDIYSFFELLTSDAE